MEVTFDLINLKIPIMNTITLFIAILFMQLMFPQENDTTTITVVIENLENNEGAVMASMYSEETFLKGKGNYNSEAKIVDGKATLTFENVPAGIYGIVAFHDANSNNQMDFDANGMPIENYGTPIINLTPMARRYGMMPNLKSHWSLK